MNFADHYLSRQKNLLPEIKESPERDLGIIVVIPCFDEPDLITSLESLLRCNEPACSVEIIIVFNSALNSSLSSIDQNRKSLDEFIEWREQHSSPNRTFHYIWREDLNNKDAGAGLARKIGMDEAIYRFNQLNQPDGILVSFDADAVCDPNYLLEIENHYRNHPGTDGTTIYFEHPLSGEDFPKEVYQGIIQYELYLRYYRSVLRFAGFPFAFHTVGSCFTVKANSYVKQGGMSKKQAGEDFYFIQKLAPLGNFNEINSTRVIPSPRPSDRVPFGTGPVVRRYMESSEESLSVYNLLSFLHLSSLFDLVNSFYKAGEEKISEIVTTLSEPVKTFLENQEAINRINEINQNSASQASFRKRFFRWFNAFMVIKFLNFSHEDYYEKIPVNVAASELLAELGKETAEDPKQLLEIYRKLEREGVN